jgi:hypothetical protein
MDPQINQIYIGVLAVGVMQAFMLILLIFSIGSSVAAYTKAAATNTSIDGERPPTRGQRAGRTAAATPTKAEAKRAAEEKALNDAIEAAVAKLIQGNGP